VQARNAGDGNDSGLEIRRQNFPVAAESGVHLPLAETDNSAAEMRNVIKSTPAFGTNPAEGFR